MVGTKQVEPVTPDDLEQIGRRLQQANFALLAIRRLAIDCADNPGNDDYANAIAELARSCVRGIEACIFRLTGDRGLGVFQTEFD